MEARLGWANNNNVHGLPAREERDLKIADTLGGGPTRLRAQLAVVKVLRRLHSCCYSLYGNKASNSGASLVGTYATLNENIRRIP